MGWVALQLQLSFHLTSPQKLSFPSTLPQPTPVTPHLPHRRYSRMLANTLNGNLNFPLVTCLYSLINVIPGIKAHTNHLRQRQNFLRFSPESSSVTQRQPSLLSLPLLSSLPLDQLPDSQHYVIYSVGMDGLVPLFLVPYFLAVDLDHNVGRMPWRDDVDYG